MSEYFTTLVNQLHEHHMLCDPPYVHGLLTGFATTPDGDLDKLYLEIAGERPLPEQLREELTDVIDFLKTCPSMTSTPCSVRIMTMNRSAGSMVI